LAEHGDVLFVDGYFRRPVHRFTLVRPTVPTRVVATVVLLQAHEGLSSCASKPAGTAGQAQ
jgi:hypothetical protein